MTDTRVDERHDLFSAFIRSLAEAQARRLADRRFCLGSQYRRLGLRPDVIEELVDEDLRDAV